MLKLPCAPSSIVPPRRESAKGSFLASVVVRAHQVFLLKQLENLEKILSRDCPTAPSKSRGHRKVNRGADNDRYKGSASVS